MENCFYCKRPFGTIWSIDGNTRKKRILKKTKDHIIPLSKNGDNSLKNIVDCCDRCNRLKGQYTPSELYDIIVSALANKNPRHGIIKRKGMTSLLNQYSHQHLRIILESLRILL